MRSILVVLASAAVLLPGLAAPTPATTASAPGVTCLTGVDINGYTWSLLVDPVTSKVTGTWDTSILGCPVYSVAGTLVGTRFRLIVKQYPQCCNCDDYGIFNGKIDPGTWLEAVS